MADMKPFVLLPLTLLAVSCIPVEPYAQQPPPYRGGEPYSPYGPGGRAPGPSCRGRESGRERRAGCGDQRRSGEDVPQRVALPG